jgi:hypothetical protein
MQPNMGNTHGKRRLSRAFRRAGSATVGALRPGAGERLLSVAAIFSSGQLLLELDGLPRQARDKRNGNLN